MNLSVPLNITQDLEKQIQALADIVIFFDEKGLILDCKSGDIALPIPSLENLLNKNIQEILPSDMKEGFDSLLVKIQQNKEVIPLEFSLPVHGQNLWYDARLTSDSLSRFIISARDITRYKETETRMQRQLKRLSALRSIDLAIASGLDLKLLLSILLDRITETLHVDAASILLMDSDLNELTFGAGKGFLTNILRHTRLRPGQGYAGRAVLERRLIHVSDLTSNKTEFERAPLFPSEKFVVYHGMPLVTKGRVLGVLEIFHRSQPQLDRDWLDFLNILSGQAAIAIDSSVMFKELQKSNLELSLAYNATIDAWSRTLDLRDKETEGHTRRVTDTTLRFAALAGIKEAELIHIRRGATLHDIGKVAIPDDILFKPGPLDQVEWETMRQHPKYAVDLLSPIKYLEHAMEIPHWHHEKWDGSGYPDHLGGEEIPFAARLFSIVDVYDALTSDRPYRTAWSKQDTLGYIESHSGSHFDPNLVPEFLDMVGASGYY